MASTPSHELVKQSAGQLMPPPPPPKRIKRPATVLDEDIYSNALSHIIARDFFPGLLETQIKQEYLEACESKDKAWIASSKKKLAGVMRTPTPGSNARRKSDHASVPSTPQHFPGRPGDTPHGWGGDTPMSVLSTSTAATETENRHIPDVSNMGLVAFQEKYTSDDNESFNKVLDKQNEKRRSKYPWLWSGNKIPSARQIAHHQQEIKRITAQGGNPQMGLIKRDEHAQPAIKTDLDARPANPDTWKSRPDNTLMFLPSSVEDTHETLPQKAEMTSRAAPKRTLYQNTRLLDPHAAAAADAVSASEAASAYAGSETPRVNGYAFVDEDEPEPEFTYGSSSKTDDMEVDWRLLGPTSEKPSPFQLSETSKREALHHRMVDRMARNKRAEQAARVTKTPVSLTPRFANSPRLDFGLRSTPGSTPGAGSSRGSVYGGGSARGKMLTPGAQRLLQQMGTPRSGEGRPGLGDVWTTTPKRMPTPRRK
ncbi:Nuclear protein DGCR14 [Penicillium verrucosum]|uniref:Nuclear protein DGCR14 n=1 Tax=Penicillium verrucosum TaxID=60171 RepID=UPI0025453E17|nr:Nuclear protein DGCR14 [Penicillium verrucosum]KAJ5931242.1 Nuclear protein DGCR14 [Penicillium verrucosum]